MTNFFAIAAKTQAQPTPPLFPQTFSTATTAFHLNVNADTSRASIEEISIQFSIPDLLPALRDFFSHYLCDCQDVVQPSRLLPSLLSPTQVVPHTLFIL